MLKGIEVFGLRKFGSNAPTVINCSWHCYPVEWKWPNFTGVSYLGMRKLERNMEGIHPLDGAKIFLNSW